MRAEWSHPVKLAFALTPSVLLPAGRAGSGAGHTWLGVVSLPVIRLLGAGLAGRPFPAIRLGETCRPDVP
ncbi:MAG TPA: hypothetical protein VI248_09160 [Kineosporiaceae bacterium]